MPTVTVSPTVTARRTVVLPPAAAQPIPYPVVEESPGRPVEDAATRVPNTTALQAPADRCPSVDSDCVIAGERPAGARREGA
jgi:hypothetical protein